MERNTQYQSLQKQMVKNNDATKNSHQLMGKQPVSNKMAGSDSNVTILMLNVNGLNVPIQRQTGKVDKKSRLNSVLYSGDLSHMQGYTKAQNKGMEEDLPSKWRAKKSRSCNSHL